MESRRARGSDKGRLATTSRYHESGLYAWSRSAQGPNRLAALTFAGHRGHNVSPRRRYVSADTMLNAKRA